MNKTPFFVISLCTAGDGGVLLVCLRLHGAHLPRPFGALGLGGVTDSLILTFTFLCRVLNINVCLKEAVNK